MNALDANTTLRSFRDACYDLGVLLRGLASLVSNEPAVRFFKYADGKVQPMAPAEFMHTLITYFESILLDGTIVLAPSQGELEVSLSRGSYTEIQARFSGSQLQFTGTAPVSISNTWIKKLVVHEILQLASLPSSALNGKTLGDLTVTGSATVKQWASQSVNAYDLAVIPGLDSATACWLASLQFGTEWWHTISGVTSGYTMATPNTVVFMPSPRLASATPTYYLGRVTSPKAADCIELTSTSMVTQPYLHQGDGYFHIQFRAPYSTYNSASRKYITDTRDVDLKPNTIISGHQPELPAMAKEMLLWPCWSTTCDYVQNRKTASFDTRTYYANFTIEVPINCSDAYPCLVVRVHNTSPNVLKKVANAWRFTAKSGSATEVVVSVLNRINIPPRSSIEFLFSYNAAMNCGFMFPSRACDA